MFRIAFFGGCAVAAKSPWTAEASGLNVDARVTVRAGDSARLDGDAFVSSEGAIGYEPQRFVRLDAGAGPSSGSGQGSGTGSAASGAGGAPSPCGIDCSISAQLELAWARPRRVAARPSC